MTGAASATSSVPRSQTVPEEERGDAPGVQREIDSFVSGSSGEPLVTVWMAAAPSDRMAALRSGAWPAGLAPLQSSDRNLRITD